MGYKIIIDGEKYGIDGVREIRTGVVEIRDGKIGFIVTDTQERAKEYAKDYWRDLADCDPKEFTCIIGMGRLLCWALGQSDGYGCRSAEDFFDLVGDNCEETLATYDGLERTVDARGRDKANKRSCDSDITVTQEFENELGFQPHFAYRTD